MQRKVEFVHIVDSMLVARRVQGHWGQVGASDAFSTYVESLRWSSHIFDNILRVLPYSILGETELYFKHLPRAANCAADFLANKALNEDIDIQDMRVDAVCATAWPITSALKIVCWSDGASRGNPGPAAAAAVVGVLQTMEPGAVMPAQTLFVHDINGIFYACRLVACAAVRLGITTCNIAEFEAACLARRLTALWLRTAGFVQ